MGSLVYTAEKANFSKTYNILQKSNIANFIEIMKPEELVSSIITTRTDDAVDKLQRNQEIEFIYNAEFLKEKNNASLNEMINLIQSVSTRGFTTYEILEDIDKKIKDDLKSNDYSSLNFNTFMSKRKEIKTREQQNYTLSDFMSKSIKIVNSAKIAETFKNTASHVLLTKDDEKYGINGKPSGSYEFNNYFYSVEEMVNGIGANTSEQLKINSDVKNADKSKPSVSAILVENPYIRVGTRNSLELAYFFNGLTNVEMSKAYPHFNIAIKLPSIVANKDTVIYRTATLNNHLFGKVNDYDKTDVFELFEQNIENSNADITKGNNTNFSIFTQPQTLVNMDEPNDRNRDFKNKERRFANVKDRTLPFLAVKSLNIDVIPSTNFISFNSGKLSIICFDRTRMSDIAPFIKPEMYGAFGAEIIIEYGWSHIDKYEKNKTQENRNLIGEFINESKRKEVYSIQSSSFSINDAGVVTIDLVIALKGPTEFRNQEITGNSLEKIKTANVVQKLKLLKDLKTKCFKDFNFIDKFEDALNITIESSKSGIIDEKYSNAIASMINIYDILPDAEEFFGTTVSNPQTIDFKSISNSFEQIETQNTNISFSSTNAEELKKIKFKFKTDFLNKKIISTKAIRDSQNYTIADSIKNAFAFSDGEKNNLNAKIFTGLELKYFLSSCELIRELSQELKLILEYMNNRQKNSKDFENKLINSMKTGYDPFWNKLFVKDLNANYDISRANLNINNNKYISFGCLLTSLVSLYMGSSMKYDDIQLVFYNTNEYAGMLSRKNIASILIDKDKLKLMLKDIYEKNQLMTLEGLITNIIRTQIQEKNHIGYGFSDIFNSFEKQAGEQTDTSSAQESLEQQVEERIKKIYWGTRDSINSEDALKFLLPSLHCSFDTISSENDDKTILRLSIYDRNDSPYSAMIDIFRKSLNSNFINDITKLNLLRRQTNLSDGPSSATFNAAVKNTVDRLIKNDIIAKDEKGNWFIKPDKKSSDVKKVLKKALPSITFANETSTILSANITAAGDGKLPSVFLVRPERNNLANLNKFRLNMPIKIIPTSLQVEMLGCPWVNFGQAIFFDFETETSLDNTYMITGIKHTIEPGLFKTSLTASFTESFGSYELSSIQLSEFIRQANIQIDSEQSPSLESQKDILRINDDDTNNSETKIPENSTLLKTSIELIQLENIINTLKPMKEILTFIKKENKFNFYVKLIENMNKGFMSVINSNNLYVNCEANRKYQFMIKNYIKKFFGTNKYTITADNDTLITLDNYFFKNFNTLDPNKRKLIGENLLKILTFNKLKKSSKIEEDECVTYIKFLDNNIPIYKKFERVIDFDFLIEFTPILGDYPNKKIEIHNFYDSNPQDIFKRFTFNEYETIKDKNIKYTKIIEIDKTIQIDVPGDTAIPPSEELIEIDTTITLFHAYSVNNEEDSYYIRIDTDYNLRLLDDRYEEEIAFEEEIKNICNILITNINFKEKEMFKILNISNSENILNKQNDDIVKTIKNEETKAIYLLKSKLYEKIIPIEQKQSKQTTPIQEETQQQQITTTVIKTPEQIRDEYIISAEKDAEELMQLNERLLKEEILSIEKMTPQEQASIEEEINEKQDIPQVTINKSPEQRSEAKSRANISLSESFKINDFEKRSAIPDELKANVKKLANELEKIKTLANKNLIIISGYRNDEYNKAVGGKDKSLHLQAKAVDFYIKPDNNEELFNTLKNLFIKIIESNDIKGCVILYDTFIHYDIRTFNNNNIDKMYINTSSRKVVYNNKQLNKNKAYLIKNK